MALDHLERPESPDDELATRSLSMEDVLRRQIDRIAWLRSMGYEWGEAVQQLRDMVVGLEDDEFFDGVPLWRRKKFGNMEHDERMKVFAQYKHEGWDCVPVRAFRGTNGFPVYRPTPDNLSAQLRIILRLLARRKITWRVKRRSFVFPNADEPSTPE